MLTRDQLTLKASKKSEGTNGKGKGKGRGKGRGRGKGKGKGKKSKKQQRGNDGHEEKGRKESHSASSSRSKKGLRRSRLEVLKRNKKGTLKRACPADAPEYEDWGDSWAPESWDETDGSWPEDWSGDEGWEYEWGCGYGGGQDWHDQWWPQESKAKKPAKAGKKHATADKKHAKADNKHAEADNKHAEADNKHAEADNKHAEADKPKAIKRAKRARAPNDQAKPTPEFQYPNSFARRACPHSKGSEAAELWKAIVRTFASEIKPSLDAGSYSKTEVGFTKRETHGINSSHSLEGSLLDLRSGSLVPIGAI